MAPASLYERALARQGEAQEAREKLLESLEELRQTADRFLAVAESTATVFATLAAARPPFPVPVATDRTGPEDAAESADAPPAPVGDHVAPFIVPEAPGVGRAVTSPNNATGRPGVPLRVTVTTTGDPVPSISFKGDPPTRIVLTDHGDGTATVSGTPKKEGVHRLVIRAKFGSGPDKYVVSQSFTLTVVDS